MNYKEYMLLCDLKLTYYNLILFKTLLSEYILYLILTNALNYLSLLQVTPPRPLIWPGTKSPKSTRTPENWRDSRSLV